MNSAAFLTDKYELTMLQAALESGAAHKKATFELFARRLPSGRRFGVVAGIERAVRAVKNFRFTEEQLSYLLEDPVFKPETISYLRNYKFEGNVWGYREGELYFPYSPILTVEGTFADAVILETVLLSILNHDSAVASAASRMVVAGRGLPLIEMGSRRTHDAAAVDSARAAYIAGFTATSNLEAGLRYGVPATGTSAHAFTLAHAEELDAFRAQVRALGVSTTLLVDTYDIPQGIRNAVLAAQELGASGPGGVRIDSGDLHEETKRARALLDSLGSTETKIVLSSDIDEYTIEDLLDRHTPVDGVGAGTRVVTGSGHPTAGMVFKLVEREDDNGQMVPVAKKASGKKSVGGFKTAFRVFNDGKFGGEYYSLNGKIPTGAMPVQVLLVDKGIPTIQPALEAARTHHAQMRDLLLPEALQLSAGDPIMTAELWTGTNE